MYCGKCGNELREGEKFCGKCGEKINIESEIPKSEKKGNIKLIYIIAFVITFSIILGIVISVTTKPIITNKNTGETSSNGSYTSSSNSTNKLSLNDVKLNVSYTSLSQMDAATNRVVTCAWKYVKDLHPNAKLVKASITQKDGYGRFWVVINYVKSSTSENVDIDGKMVWIKDINDLNNMGYYYYGSVIEGSNGWGTPLNN